MNKIQNKVLTEEVEGENGGCYLRAQVLREVLKTSSPLALIIRGSAKFLQWVTLALYTRNPSGSINVLSVFITRKLLSKRSTTHLPPTGPSGGGPHVNKLEQIRRVQV